ncbi:MAG: ABC transporter ATP-binding protein [Sarcina sp.]
MSSISIRELSFNIGKKEILKNISFDIKENNFVGIIGENGSGKSTILKNIYKAYKPKKNMVFVSGRDIYDIKKKEFSKVISVLHQENSADFDFTVEEIVKMGRYAHKTILASYDLEDDKIVQQTLSDMGLLQYKNKKFNEISGGEKQRVLIARAIVQETEIIILDEPMNHLDIKYQLQIMSYLKGINKTIIMTVHDVNIASMYCDFIVAIKNGEVISKGQVDEVLTQEVIEKVYGIKAIVEVNTRTNRKNICFIP